MLAVDVHPDADVLTQFGLGQLSDQESAPIEEHVAACERCRQFLETAPGDALVARLHQVASGTPAPPLVRTELGGYELLEEIGRGGMGIVYRARQIALDRIVALKMLRGGLPALAEDSVRFHAEAAAVARLRHPNIVQIFEVGERDGQPYLALEYVGGGTLAQQLAGNPLPPAAAAALVETLAYALDHAHTQGIIHRDLKPANVLVGSGQSAVGSANQASALPTAHYPLPTEVKIADFGLAKFVNAPDGPTRTGAVLGTPSYMAPEQTMGDGATVGPATDIYALGAILYECLTGRPPFRAATMLETLEQVRANEPVSVRTIQPRTPPDLETICLTCLRKEPSRRYRSAKELADDLRRYQTGEAILARRTGVGERIQKWVRRKPAQAAIVALCVVAATAAIIGVSVHNALLRAEADRADSEKRRAAEHYREASETLRRVLAHGAPGTVTPTSRITEVRLQQLEDAIAFYRAAASADETDPEVRYDLALAHLAASTELSLQSRHDRAEPHLVESRAILEELSTSYPQSIAYRKSLGHCFSNLGFLHLTLGHHAQAQQFHNSAMQVRERLAAEVASDHEHNRALAESCLNMGGVCLALSKVSEAEAHYRRATDLWVREYRERPEPYAAYSLAECKSNLALLTMTSERMDEASAMHQEIEALLSPLIGDPKIGIGSSTALASAKVNYANVLRKAGRTQDMFFHFSRAEQLLKSVEQREPTWCSGRDTSFALHGARAEALIELKRHAEALQDWDRALAVAVNDQQRNQVGLLRLFTRIQLGDHAAATREAAEIAIRPGIDGLTSYNLACVFGRSIPLALSDPTLDDAGRKVRAEDYAARAMHCLFACKAAGFLRDRANVDNMLKDEDLEPLKTRAEYQSFLRTLQSP